MTERRNTFQQLTDVLSGDDDFELGIVFGSAAAGTLRPDSDVDVAVLTRTPMQAERKRALTAALATATGRAVDLVDLRAAGIGVTSVVLRNGKRVLCRRRRVYADLLARHREAMPLRPAFRVHAHGYSGDEQCKGGVSDACKRRSTLDAGHAPKAAGS